MMLQSINAYSSEIQIFNAYLEVYHAISGPILHQSVKTQIRPLVSSYMSNVHKLEARKKKKKKKIVYIKIYFLQSRVIDIGVTHS